MSFVARTAHTSTATPELAVRGTSAVAAPRRLFGGRVAPYEVLLVALMLLAGGFYMWTAATSIPFSFSPSNEDVYNQMTTAFLHGHTYLPITPPAGLLRLRDPYNPVENGPWNITFHDLSLYHGRFYSDWGPTPVLTLFAPFRVTGLRMSESFAAALYGFIGLICGFLLLRVLVERLVPNTPRWLLPVALVGLAFTNAVPFLLRRPVQYEVAIACALCFEMAGLWLMVTSVIGPRLIRWRMIAGSLCLGLAFAARPTMAVGGAVALVVAVWEHRRHSGSYGPRVTAEMIKLLAAALGPFALCAILFGLYNEVSFGGFTNFGERYALSGIDQMGAPFESLKWVPPGVFTYLFLPLRLALTFPHVFLQTVLNDPFSLPRGYAGTYPRLAPEVTGGIVPTAPITLFLFGIPLLWRQPAPGDRRPLVAATGLTLLGLIVLVGLSWALFGTTEIYVVDFASLLLIPAFLVWAMLVARARRRTAARRVWAIGGVVVTLIGVAVGTAISFTGYQELLKLEHPATFNLLEDLTSPFATVATMIGGRPQLARIENGAFRVTPGAGVSEFSEDHASAWLGTVPLSLVVLSPEHRHDEIYANITPGRGAPPLSSLAIRVTSQGLPVTVPLSGTSVVLPVSLHWGLNRIHLAIAGTATSIKEVLLSDIDFGRGRANAGATPAARPTTEALSGTIIVHVSGSSRSSSQQGLKITRLGSKGEEITSLETAERAIHLAPGVFAVTVPGTPPEKGLPGAGQKVTVGADEEVSVTIALHQGRHPSAQHRRSNRSGRHRGS
jgi:hypothetical protein